MSEPYLAEIRMFGGNFAPAGNALCNGQLLAISQNTALFSLLGTTYGGDGVSTFGLPNMQSRAPMHFGQGTGLTNRLIGESAGTESVTLTSLQNPPHTHTFNTYTNAATEASPTGALLGKVRTGNLYGTAGNQVAFGATSIGSVGGLPHNNIQPYLAITFIIALQGIFPSRN